MHYHVVSTAFTTRITVRKSSVTPSSCLIFCLWTSLQSFRVLLGYTSPRHSEGYSLFMFTPKISHFDRMIRYFFQQIDFQKSEPWTPWKREILRHYRSWTNEKSNSLETFFRLKHKQFLDFSMTICINKTRKASCAHNYLWIIWNTQLMLKKCFFFLLSLRIVPS